jgi:hypothetical protein
MTYNADLTWIDLSKSLGRHANLLYSSMVEGNKQYDEWQSFRAGRTNADIATALGRTETEIAEMDAAYAAMKAIYDYANNQPPTQSDYLYSLRKFT